MREHQREASGLIAESRDLHTSKEAKAVIEGWRRHYNTVNPPSPLGNRPPAPELLVSASKLAPRPTLTYLHRRITQIRQASFAPCECGWIFNALCRTYALTCAEAKIVAAYAETTKNGASTEADTSRTNEFLRVRIVKLLKPGALSLE